MTCPCPDCRHLQSGIISTLRKLAAETVLWRPFFRGVHPVRIMMVEDMPPEDQPIIRRVINRYPMKISGIGTFYACAIRDEELLIMDTTHQN